jgi:NRAMP (natural resistance-associated macrophage protein)-like metal ion transporter
MIAKEEKLGAVPAAAVRPAPRLPLLKQLGPGLITGAADDDPSGIASYSQAGAQFGYGMLWSVLFTLPLMIGIQIVSARIGRVTGHGLAANIRQHYPKSLLYAVIALLLVANTINIAADLGAMAAALQLLVGGSTRLYIVAFALVSLGLQVFIPFPRYAPFLKWLTLALFAYVATVFVVRVPWLEAGLHTLVPDLALRADYLLTLVAVFGTTISPYLFFWQASQEVEEQRAADGEAPLREAPEQAKAHLHRIKIDTYIGMTFSNLVAFFIMLTTAVTLHAHGITDIQTSAQAAEALRPIGGEFAFLLFAAGIVGTGMLAVPVLAGSAAYAVAESFRWPIGLGLRLMEARGFYAILIAATTIGVALNFTEIDPVKALIWSAVINGVISVPIMAVMMLMAARPEIMGPFTARRRLKNLGWLATGVMALAVVAMLLAFLAAPARAQEPADYPSRPIRILVGFTPGGGPDITARYVAPKLGEAWKQQVIVDNRPGAGGTLAAGMVARAAPDGATLLSVSSAHAIAPILYSNLTYDTFRDLSGITLSAASKYVLVVSPSLGIRSVKELIAQARAKPGSLNFSSAGVGSGTHFAGEMFKAMAAIDVVHVPFKGIPEALTETLTGRVQFFMAPIANAVGQVREGKLAGLGVSSAERDPLLPEVPTVAEAGVPGYESILWFGLLTSSAVPKPIVTKLNREIVRILSQPDAKERWIPIGLQPQPTTPEGFDKLIRDDVATFTKIARGANIKAE